MAWHTMWFRYTSRHGGEQKVVAPAATVFRAVFCTLCSMFLAAPAVGAAPQFHGLQQQSQQRWAQRLGCEAREVNSLGMALVLIPPGEFMMGSSAKEIDALIATISDKPQRAEMYRNEGPRHRVEISQPFYLGQTAVTVGQFRQFVKATGYRTEAERDVQGGFGMVDRSWQRDAKYLWNQRADFEQTDDHPVVNVSWHDAVAFCEWLTQTERSGSGELTTSRRLKLATYRLPTEAEWEYACRAGTTTRWHTGDDPASIAASAWLRENSQWHTHVVGKLQPNAFGLHDMQGNARNWCHDLYAVNYYSRSPQVDPQGPQGQLADSPERRIVRGSAFHAYPNFARSAMRFADPPEHRHGQLGFRVVRSAE